MELAATIAEYSVVVDPTTPDGTKPVEVTTGFRLLGTPVGSPEFATSYFAEQVESAEADATALHNHIADLQTRLRIFAQCTSNKLSHLLGADIMHHLPLNNFDGATWSSWNGPLTSAFDSLISSFLSNLTEQPDLPDHSLLISQIRTSHGGAQPTLC